MWEGLFNTRQLREWVEDAQKIDARFGIEKALGYLIGEKFRLLGVLTVTLVLLVEFRLRLLPSCYCVKLIIRMKKKVLFTFLIILLLFVGYAFSADKHQCDYCHTPHGMAEGTPLKAPVSDLCLGCHPDRKSPREHKIDIVPSMQVKGLPLSKDGKMTCVTCHDPHGKSSQPKLLRINLSELCLKCHFSNGS